MILPAHTGDLCARAVEPPEQSGRAMPSISPESVRILVGYECSGTVRRAFRRLGFDAWSCDTQPAKDGSEYHLLGDVWDYLQAENGWDFGIFHPVCTYLTIAAAWAFKDPDFERFPGIGYHQRLKPGTLTGKARREARVRSLAEVERLLALPYPVAIENPQGFIGTMLAKPTQMIQPHEFGNNASKGTCLWLRGGTPKLVPTYNWPPRAVGGKPRWGNQTDSGQNRLSPSDDRPDERSVTYPGIASAMAAQWGAWLIGRKLTDFHLDGLRELEALI